MNLFLPFPSIFKLSYQGVNLPWWRVRLLIYSVFSIASGNLWPSLYRLLCHHDSTLSTTILSNLLNTQPIELSTEMKHCSCMIHLNSSSYYGNNSPKIPQPLNKVK